MNRAFLQSGELVGRFLEGLSLQLEAAAQAASLDDLFARLEAAEQLLRVDRSVQPTKYNGATVTAAEIEALRRIEDVVRLGQVRRIERDAIVLERGQGPDEARTPARPLRRARPQPRARRPHLHGRSHHAAADPPGPHPVQRGDGRLRRGDARRRPGGEEPPLPAEPAAGRAARLGARNADRHERRLSLEEGARHRRLARALAAQHQPRPAAALRRSPGAGRDQALRRAARGPVWRSSRSSRRPRARRRPAARSRYPHPVSPSPGRGSHVDRSPHRHSPFSRGSSHPGGRALSRVR